MIRKLVMFESSFFYSDMCCAEGSMNDCVELRLIAGYSFKNADVWFNIVLPLAQFSCSCTSTHGLLSV